ncbi:MAG TPA: tautomerase family protein [Thermoleophilaceae bacterium]|jgi:phenylpyruvate tautomerase PptA (4-oxalocrotonate tautomerase family)
MPMIDFTLPQGTFDEEALDRLSDSLMRALLRAERAPEEAATRGSIAWFFVHDLPPSRMYGGGRRLEGGRPAFRLDISVPEGALSPRRKNEFVEEATRLIVEATGADPSDPAAAGRVWILFREVAEGSWGAGGRVVGIEEIAAAVGASAGAPAV